MNKKVIALIVGLFVFGLLVATCPDRQAHQDTLKAVATSYVEKSVAERTQDDSGVFGLIGSVLSGPFVNAFLDAKLQVHNYLVVSGPDNPQGHHEDRVRGAAQPCVYLFDGQHRPGSRLRQVGSHSPSAQWPWRLSGRSV